MKGHKHDPIGESLREIVFGVEDGSIGNLGIVVGLAQAMASNKIIFLAGIATMLAQMISMSAGTYLSSKSEKEYFSAKRERKKFGKLAFHKNPAVSAAVMGLAVMLGAAIPLLSFFFFESQAGILPAVIITLSGLFALGCFKAKYTKKNYLRSGSEMVFIGGLAALAGYAVGTLFGMV